MEKIVIYGGEPLHGEIAIGGMKNAALPILFATILTKGTCTISNIPDISDIRDTISILKSIGASVRFIDTTTAIIDTTSVKSKNPPCELISKMRASYYLWGTMLGRFHEVQINQPGGCDLGGGSRPVDQHIRSLIMLGATPSFESTALISMNAPNGLKGPSISFDVVSVGTTINIMFAAALAEGVTVIKNAACEPHIVDTACFLNACGANITGAGTSTIRIKGVKELKGCDYTIAPDMIEAGTYMIAAAITKSKLSITNVIPKHLECITSKLIEAGVPMEFGSNYITVLPVEQLKGTPMRASPYPGFPTDMHPQFCALMALTPGEISSICDGVYSERFAYTKELIKMGANIEFIKENNTLSIIGVKELNGIEVVAPDLRGGAALILAGLATKGTTTISDIHFIDRGYDHIVEKLRSIGANIKREKF